ncbi:MAG: alkaline phosphatase family protein [Myxococcota bacterium]
MERAFDRILVIMFENQYREYVMANPYMRGLARQGIDMANFHGVMHPSQTNYIASVSGELCNVTDDDSPGLLPQRTIVDLIEEAPGDLQWKAYMDGYRPAKTPWTPELVPQDDFPYVIKHNPFSSYGNIVRNELRWKRIVDQTQFFRDVLNGELPHYAWFTPDMWNDGHYTDGTQSEPAERAPALVDQLARWLEEFFGALDFPGPDSRLPKGTLVVVTFDESDFLKKFDAGKKYTYDGPNQVYTVLLGDMIEPGVQDGAYNHYNLLRTIELNFGLGDLGKNDAGATPLRFLWGQTFDWEPPEDTPIHTHGHVASAGLGDVLHVVVRDEDGGLRHTTFNGQAWGVPRPIGARSTGPLCMAARGDQLVLMFAGDKGQLSSLTYDLQHGWSSEPEAVAVGESRHIALCAFGGGSELMAVWVDGEAIKSRRYDGSGWAPDTTDTGHTTQGALAIGAIGPSLFLVFQSEDGGLSAVTYNTADFNTTTVATSKYSGPWDDTVANQWSPSAFAVGRFGAAAFEGTPKELEPVTVPVESGAPVVMAAHDGTLHLAHAGVANRQLLTERFSVPGVLTPKLRVSYKATEDKTTSNGYGTLAEAGWTSSEPIDFSWVGEGGAASMATVGDELVLLAQPEAGGPLQILVAGYEQE